MAFLTDEKLVIVGAGGMIGSNMVQSVLMLGLTPNICLYDIYEPGVHGVYDEMCHCAFPGANISYTVDPKEAFTGAKYIISSGGAPRKEGMTREDLLKGNCQIAADFGENIKKYCPDVLPGRKARSSYLQPRRRNSAYSSYSLRFEAQPADLSGSSRLYPSAAAAGSGVRRSSGQGYQRLHIRWSR